MGHAPSASKEKELEARRCLEDLMGSCGLGYDLPERERTVVDGRITNVEIRGATLRVQEKPLKKKTNIAGEVVGLRANLTRYSGQEFARPSNPM